ncbi:diacylglycerol/lipid kinase family protein [Enterococcus xiangfangensis]|uniref:diacylglycerol/lipid kinase family protein n=1 Tax=Enterococcus xiangfangensis TaxID=1296537 RepID=UPI0010F9C566|nr:YegS/Rv2252/BmrU family lipid kinase [Enterococcus xiangfangensis]MBM7712466.1 YegS/Rv2252/BmrU family lipid kinase [Enterococcus xiangfangensis]NBK09497.1 YegS/Rv2252/BmrU family lipid kinase [Enterococcus asini]
MKFHYHILINPAAGSGNAAKTAETIIQLLDNGDYIYTPYYTENPGDERVIVERIIDLLSPWSATSEQEHVDRSFHLLVVIGGDGTLHEVVNQFYALDRQLPVSYIPAGSGNDFARGIGLSRDPEKAFEQIISAEKPQPINTFRYEEKIREERGVVLNNVGIGLDALIVAATNASSSKKLLNKYRLGSASYALHLVKAIFTQKTFPILVELNGKTLNFERTFLCTTTNVPYFGGGIAIAPMADPKKDMIDLVVVEKPNLPAILRFLIQLLQKKHTQNKHYQHYTSSRIRIVSVIPQYGQADGESMGERSFDMNFSTATQYIWYADKRTEK